MHHCDNDVCKLLNPSLTELLRYQDLKDRISEVEKLFHIDMKNKSKIMSSGQVPLDLWSWSKYHMVYQFPNAEFIQELAKVIKEINPEIILEVGSGRGIICRNISKIIGKEIMLSDDYSWELHAWEKDVYSDVIQMNYKNAIKKFMPDLILSSWIPYNQEWTKYFRKYPYVNGYIIIGEHRGGCTGSDKDWKTKWKMCELEDVERFGICRTDHGFDFGDPILHTNVTYFERPKKSK